MHAVLRNRSRICSVTCRFGQARNLYVEPFLREAKSFVVEVLDRQPHEVRGSLSRAHQLLATKPRIFDSFLTLDELSQYKKNMRAASTEEILSGV